MCTDEEGKLRVLIFRYPDDGETYDGIRPSERRKGYAVQSLKLMLEQAKAKNIKKVLIGVHEGNIASWKTVEKCGGVLENTVHVAGDDEAIRRYWIELN